MTDPRLSEAAAAELAEAFAALPDTRRVCDMTAADLLQLVLASLVMDVGEWDITLRASNGIPRRLHGKLVAAGPHGTTLGLRQLREVRP